MSVSIFFYLFFFILKPVKCEWEYIAVVEYQPFNNPDLSKEENLAKNVENYIKIMKEVPKSQGFNIIIFPEETLDNVKAAEDISFYGVKINMKDEPCTTHRKKYPKYIQELACAAKDQKVNIVVNLIESQTNEYYTSDVVIDAKGVIQFSLPREHRVGMKDLDADPIPFVIPIRRVLYHIHNYNLFLFTVTSFITGFSFSVEKVIAYDSQRDYFICSNWISQFPFLTSLQVYQMWAQEFNVTLFFSSANNPKRGQGGTGVYHGGPLLMDIVSTGGTRVYIYNFTTDDKPGQITGFVPDNNKSIDQVAKEMDKFHLEVDPDLYRYKSITINPDASKLVQRVCYNVGNFFCCDFNITLSVQATDKKKRRYTYHMVAYKGYKTYYDIFEPGGVEICAVIACVNQNVSSCGRRFLKYKKIEWPLTFKKIVISATFNLPLRQKIYINSQFPNSLLSSIRPIHPNFTKWETKIITDAFNVSSLVRTFTLTVPQNRILTFGIFGRNFTLIDPRSGSCRFLLNPVFLSCIAFLALF